MPLADGDFVLDCFDGLLTAPLSVSFRFQVEDVPDPDFAMLSPKC